MKWRWVIFLLALAFFAVFGAVVGVGVKVPMNFSVHVSGRVRPVRTVRVLASASGTALQVRRAGPVRQGDLLLRQAAETEEQRVSALAEQLALLRERRAHEEEKLNLVRDALENEAGMLDLAHADTAARLEEVSGPLAELERDIQRKTIAQQRVESDRARDEFEILNRLAAEQSVPLMEVARSRAEAASAKLEVERLELDENRRGLVLSHTVRALQTELKRQELRIKELELRGRDRSAVLQLSQEILRLQAELAAVEQALSRKSLIAPCAGEWIAVAVAAAEYVNAGTQVGCLAVDGGLVFEGSVREERLPWLAVGQMAQVRIAAYPFIRYGTVPARVARLEFEPCPGPPEVFRVELALGEFSGFRVSPGMSGRADITVFRGTLLEYLFAEPEDRLLPRLPGAVRNPTSGQAP